MSSEYRAICLNHDPAIELESEWQSMDEAAEAVRLRSDWRLQHHANCDLLIARYSGALFEIGCPAGSKHAGSWHPHSTEWVYVSWLRLLVAAAGEETTGTLTARALEGFRGCWAPARVLRLRALLWDEGEPA